MGTRGVTPTQAARELGLSPSTVRRDVRRGAPVISQGGTGPGRATRLVLADYERWRRGDPLTWQAVDALEAAMLDLLKRDAGDGRPMHVELGIPERNAAAMLLALFERFHQRFAGSAPARLPEAIEQRVRVLSGCARDSTERSHQ